MKQFIYSTLEQAELRFGFDRFSDLRDRVDFGDASQQLMCDLLDRCHELHYDSLAH